MSRHGKATRKGGVEGEAGYFRRNHWLSVPEAKDIEELDRSSKRIVERAGVCSLGWRFVISISRSSQ